MIRNSTPVARNHRHRPRSGTFAWMVPAVVITLIWLVACGEEAPPDHPLVGQAMFALGQEPGWYVDLEPEGEVRFVLDYGTDTVITRTPRPTVPPSGPRARGLVYRVTSEDDPLVLTLFDRPCTDAMSGRPFPATATLRVGERELRGCARPEGDN